MHSKHWLINAQIITTTSLGCIDMRTGERRLAARAWVGAASSARANAHRAAAILSVYNESFAMAYSNSDAQRLKSSLALEVVMEVS